MSEKTYARQGYSAPQYQQQQRMLREADNNLGGHEDGANNDDKYKKTDVHCKQKVCNLLLLLLLQC